MFIYESTLMRRPLYSVSPHFRRIITGSLILKIWGVRFGCFYFGRRGWGFACVCMCVCVCVSGGMEGVAGIENILDWASPRQEGVWLSGGEGLNLQSL